MAGRTANTEVREVAQRYNQAHGLPAIIEGHYVKVDEQRATRIAQAYEQLPVNDAHNPQVRQAYGALAQEVQAQWEHALAHGYALEAWTQPGQPYANSREMVADVATHRHLYFFTGGDEHPLLGDKDQQGLSLNDKFRAIHDLYGHAAEGFEFGPRGEENAWLKHSQMFSALAQHALTTETRGQNSWVNFGPHRDLPPAERPFAQQKAALLPIEFTVWHATLVDSRNPLS